LGFSGSVSVNTLPHTHNQTLQDDGGQLSETLTDMNGVTLYSLITAAAGGIETHEFTTAETWTPTTQTGIMEVLVDTTTMSAGTLNVTVDGVLAETITTPTTSTRLYDPSSSITIQTASAISKLWESTNSGDSETMRTGATLKVGQVFSTGHVLIGTTPTKIIFNLRERLSPSGTIQCQLVDSSDVEKTNFGTLDSTTLTASYVSYTFENLAASAVIADGDRIIVTYSGADGVQVSINETTTESYTTESYWVSSWTNRVDANCEMEVWGSSAFSGTVYASVSQ